MPPNNKTMTKNIFIKILHILFSIRVRNEAPGKQIIHKQPQQTQTNHRQYPRPKKSLHETDSGPDKITDNASGPPGGAALQYAAKNHQRYKNNKSKQVSLPVAKNTAFGNKKSPKKNNFLSYKTNSRK